MTSGNFSYTGKGRGNQLKNGGTNYLIFLDKGHGCLAKFPIPVHLARVPNNLLAFPLKLDAQPEVDLSRAIPTNCHDSGSEFRNRSRRESDDFRNFDKRVIPLAGSVLDEPFELFVFVLVLGEVLYWDRSLPPHCP